MTNQGIIKINRKDKLTLEKAIGLPYYIILIGLVLIPVIVMVFYSVQESASGLFSSRFTLSHYASFLSKVDFINVMINSIWLAVLATIITLLIAYPLALAVTKFKLVSQGLLVLLITGTMWINMILRTNALVQIFSMIHAFTGVRLLETNLASVIGMVYIFLPYMFLPIYTVLSKIDHSLIEAAEDLGANKYQVLKQVVIPLSLPGVTSGLTMVLLPAATTIAIPRYLGPTTKLMIGELIENEALLSGKINSASAIAILLSVIMILMLIGLKKIDRYKGSEKNA
ncbi:Spermidine/putrescine ABC superfamily ATP binding cassette transporter, permease protein [Alteracholeplasma palmae J233]|uniref:Spermidine/putrescine ABC superfamily ATP binding cassette transporter, permease protein n=1 Tax=Alteracholeplasma palmae (strain ATCC 49389 / J233) TaxID=1318466 RepID=U4KQI8_ALTPJ|nr:ABC transporter permease [Alteracholeplasma palmae]CCV64655.1 Spermidine/putrescine ABC superfamily ATP binding cassette transporter, permease protein [Alteracholeplasma palmae J233]